MENYFRNKRKLLIWTFLIMWTIVGYPLSKLFIYTDGHIIIKLLIVFIWVIWVIGIYFIWVLIKSRKKS